MGAWEVPPKASGLAASCIMPVLVYAYLSAGSTTHTHVFPALDLSTHCPASQSPQVPLAFMILLDPAFYKDTIWAGNDFSTLVMAISAGYFLYDTLEVRSMQGAGAWWAAWQWLATGKFRPTLE